jgi:hypothetical protein
MKCPVQIARDQSSEGKRKRISHPAVRRQNATMLGNRLGAGDESAGIDFAGDGVNPLMLPSCVTIRRTISIAEVAMI